MSTDDTNGRNQGSAGHDPTADLLRQALHEEAAVVQTDPSALHEIQARTSGGTSPRRSWVYAGVGAAAATAAVIAGVAVASNHSDPSSGPAPATQGSNTDSAPTQNTDPTDGTTEGVPTTGQASTPVAVTQTEPGSLIYVGADTHRLFAEGHPVPVDDNLATMNDWLASTPDDPDYTTGWPAGVHVDTITELNSGARLELSGPADAAIGDDPGLGKGGGELAITALLYNGNFQAGEGMSEVTYNGQPISTLLGVSTPFVLPADDDVRAFIIITDLSEGQTVSSPVTVHVLGNTFEGNVNWQLLDGSGAKVDEGFVTTSMGQWTEAPIHLGNLDPGTYTLRCLEYSPKDGSPGNVDDKTFTVQ